MDQIGLALAGVNYQVSSSLLVSRKEECGSREPTPRVLLKPNKKRRLPVLSLSKESLRLHAECLLLLTFYCLLSTPCPMLYALCLLPITYNLNHLIILLGIEFAGVSDPEGNPVGVKIFQKGDGPFSRNSKQFLELGYLHLSPRPQIINQLSLDFF